MFDSRSHVIKTTHYIETNNKVMEIIDSYKNIYALNTSDF